MSEEMAERTKWRAIENDIWGGNEHIKESNSGTFKNIIKIRLHISEFKANYGRKGWTIDAHCASQKRILEKMSQSVKKKTINSI